MLRGKKLWLSLWCFVLELVQGQLGLPSCLFCVQSSPAVLSTLTAEAGRRRSPLHPRNSHCKSTQYCPQISFKGGVSFRTDTMGEERDLPNALYGMEELKKPLNDDGNGDASGEDMMEYNDMYRGANVVENNYASVREGPHYSPQYHYVRY